MNRGDANSVSEHALELAEARSTWRLGATAVLALAASHGLLAATLQVGPDKALRNPSDAAAAARDGDIIEIAAGVYRGDAAIWQADNLTIRGVGGRARIEADGATAEDKAIWVIKGDNTRVENVELSGARVPDGNGAGIRHEGGDLYIGGSRFHGNEVGLMTSNNERSNVVVEHSEFDHNVRGDGDVSHNIYIGGIRSFTLQFSYVHHAAIGHNVKSRADTNRIFYNLIADERDGTSSYAVDIPWGGETLIVGNVIQKGWQADNNTLISYAAEGAENAVQDLYVVNNTLISEVPTGTFVRAFGTPRNVRIVNNIMSGVGVITAPGAEAHHNLVGRGLTFAAPASHDFRVLRDTRVVDGGVDPGTAGDEALIPRFEYLHPLGSRSRARNAALDLGAFETGAADAR